MFRVSLKVWVMQGYIRPTVSQQGMSAPTTMPVKRRLLKPGAEFVQHPVVASSPRLLTIPMAAAYLSCSVWSIRNLIWNRAIPHIQIGKRFLLDRADLDSYVEKNKVRS